MKMQNFRTRCLGLAFMLSLVAAFASSPGTRAQEDTGDGSTPATVAPARGGRSGSAGYAAAREAATSNAPAAREGPSASLAATIYEIHMPADQIGRLDVDALTAAAGVGDFDKALAALGTGRPLYFVQQSVRLAEDHLQLMAQMPYITNSQTDNTGKVINSVAYTSVGAIISIRGIPKASGSIELDTFVQVSTITQGGVAISEKVKAPYFRVANMAFKGPVQPNKAFVLISADGATLDADGKAVAYIAKVTLGVPQ
jgi:hypothetical protein